MSSFSEFPRQKEALFAILSVLGGLQSWDPELKAHPNFSVRIETCSQIVCEEPCSEEALPRKKNLQVRIGQRASRVLAPVQEATLCQFCQFGCCQVLYDIVGRAL